MGMLSARPIAAMAGPGRNIRLINKALLRGVSRDGVYMEWLFLVGIGREIKSVVQVCPEANQGRGCSTFYWEPG
ncbi:hypothetical protein PSCICL_01110 [Pseudomonas cichorii]|nr:hypothetical protein PSCICE_49370 [Pseudomonas cichorii]GFM56375.1 hypothetical protein PSCICF_25530 [Pseudomonas cichorii]GFM59098.1 hypothetical protein PSCICG_02580 [Pseudomonas cichorii]GFM69119.1 hypothetical protein PSCICL_01110 [Pseudomonas cichorii]